MKIAFNPSTANALTTISSANQHDIIFDLKGRNIFARGVKFFGTDTQVNVIDNLTSNDSKSALSANMGRYLNLIKTPYNNTSTPSSAPSAYNIEICPITSVWYSSLSIPDGGGGLLIRGNTGTAFNLWLHDTSNVWYKQTASGAWKKMDAGNADTASKFQTARTINGTSFDGSSNIVTSYWGTSRNITIGNTTKSVNGSTNISWSLSELGAASSGHNHDGRYVYNYGGSDCKDAGLGNNYMGMTTSSGIDSNWWHVLSAGWNGEYRWNSQIGFPTQNRNGFYYRSGKDDNTGWGSWVKLIDINNYAGILDSRYYTESEVNNLLNKKLDRVNLTTGTWNPRGYNLAADYHYNGGDMSLSESDGKMHVSIDGKFWQNEGQYRVLDTSDLNGVYNTLTINQYLSTTDTTWWPLIWGGSVHNNTNNSTGAVYKSYSALTWQTSSQTLYTTKLRTTGIIFPDIGNEATSGKISWNGSTDGADIYYQTTTSDQGNLVLNVRDDNNCYIRLALNGTFKSYFDVANSYWSGKSNLANKWATARTFKIGNSAKTVDGSSDISWTLSEIGVQNTWRQVNVNGTSIGSATLNLVSGNYIGVSNDNGKVTFNLIGSTTTANQAILSNGTANQWKLQTLNIDNWNNAWNWISSITTADTDKVINKWNEILNFLAGIDSSNKLNTLLNSKLSITQIAAKSDISTLKNNAIYWVDTKNNASGLTNGPFTNSPFAMLSITNYNAGTFSYRSRLAFNDLGEIKVAKCHSESSQNWTDTWYNILTSNNSGISGSTIKINGTSITVNSSTDADNKYVKKAGDTMTGALNFGAAFQINNLRVIDNEPSTSSHKLVLGYSGFNKAEWFEYGGTWNFYKTSNTQTLLVQLGVTSTFNGQVSINSSNFGALSVKRNDTSNGASIRYSGSSNVYGYIGFNAAAKDKQALRWSSDTSKVYTILDTSSTYINDKTITINGVSTTWSDHTYNFSGTTFVSGNSYNGEHNANSITYNGHFYYTSNGPATNLGATTNDGAIYSQAFNDNWVGQIAQDYRNGRLFVRGKNNGTWQNWLKILDTGTTYVSNNEGYINGTKITQVSNATNAANSDTVDNEHASAFTRIVGRQSIYTSGTAPYNYILLFRIANKSSYSTVDCEIDLRTRFHTAKIEIRISTNQYPYNSEGSSISIVKKVISGRSCRLWVLSTVQTSDYNYYDVYYESGAWNSGSYDITLRGSNGTIVFEHKGTNLSSLPSNVSEVTNQWISWNDIAGKPGTFTPASHNHDGTYLRLSGADTMVGALKLANNTWNLIGDDVKVGDHNVSGGLGILGANGNTRVDFCQYGNASNYKSITFDGTTLYLNGTSYNAERLLGYSLNISDMQKPFGKIPVIDTNGVTELGRYIDFHYDNTTNSDYSTRLQVQGNYSNVVNLPTASGTLALTSQIPTALKSPYSLIIQTNGTTLGSYDGSAAKTWNITYSNVGAAAANHNHTSLSGVTRINFATESTDSCYIGTTVIDSATHLDFYLSDDANQESYRWIFGDCTAIGTKTIMELLPTNNANTALKLYGSYVATQSWASSQYVTSLGTSGRNLTWTKNGTTNNITVPFATYSSALKSTGDDGNWYNWVYWNGSYFWLKAGTSIYNNNTATLKTAVDYSTMSSYLIDNGIHNETASGTTANASNAGMLYGSGMYMTKTYSDSTMPTSYGNVINVAGTGSGQLLLGWSGSDSTTGNIYYRSHRDTNSGGWGSWRRLLYSDESIKNPNPIKFRDINGNSVSYDGSSTVDLTAGTYIAKLPYGFSSWSSGVGWGNTTGTSFASWNDSTGGSIDFRRDNPSSGKMSIKVDGRVYVNEGLNPVLSSSYDNGFWGIRTPDGGNNWIRTPDAGLIPYVSGGAGSGHSSLGTSSWYFSTAYIDKVYGSLVGNADTVDGYHASDLFTALSNSNNGITMTIGGTTRSISNIKVGSASVLSKNSVFNDSNTGNLSYFDGYISNTSNSAAWSAPLEGWCQIIHNDLSVTNYWTELAFPVNDVHGLAWRQRRDTQFYGWYRILDSNNYNNYVPTKTGTGASGTWGINISGTAANADKLGGYSASGLFTTLSNSNYGVSLTIGGTTKSISNISVNYAKSASNADLLDGYHASNFASSSHNHDGRYAISENYGGFIRTGRLPISGFYQSYESTSGGNAPWTSWVHLINCQHSNTSNNYALQIAASFYDNNTFKIRVTNNNIDNTWRDIIHSGNIASQSVSYADNAGTVDGYHVNDPSISSTRGQPFGKIPVVYSDGVMEVGRYLDFHYNNTSNTDFSTRLCSEGDYSNYVRLPSTSGTLALTSQIPTIKWAIYSISDSTSYSKKAGNTDFIESVSYSNLSEDTLISLKSVITSDNSSWLYKTFVNAVALSSEPVSLSLHKNEYYTSQNTRVAEITLYTQGKFSGYLYFLYIA